MNDIVTYRKRLAIIVLAVVGFLISSTQLVSIYLTLDGERYAREINLAGRQRMLSQKIAKEILASDSPVSSSVTADVMLWQRVHEGLQVGDPLLNLKGVKS